MTTTAEFLLIDVGNTTTKLRLATHTRLLGKTRRLLTTDLTRTTASASASLRTMLAEWEPARVVVSSVVPDAMRAILRMFPRTVPVTADLDAGVDLRGYSGTATLGADRIANVVGALARHGPGPLIVVDFGTAATFNALDARGRFLGGIIAPGRSAVANYLPAHTAQLPPIRLAGQVPRAIGRNTREAMRAGAIIGYRGLVRELVDALRAELAPGAGETVRIIATGGDAAWVARILPGTFAATEPDLTLHGLRLIAARVFPPTGELSHRSTATG